MNDEFGNFISCICNLSKFWLVSRLKLVFNQPSFKHIYYLFLLYQSFSNFAYSLLQHSEPSNAFVMRVDKDSTSFLCIIVENMQQ
jgi:hypothetical protein